MSIELFWKALVGSKMFTNRAHQIAIIAQSMLESNHGASLLAKAHNNFCGVMWKREFEGHWQLAKTEYTSPSDNITTNYLSCAKPEDFLLGYEILIGRSIYEGWKNTSSSLDYIKHLKACGYAADPKYIEKVAALMPKAIEAYEKILASDTDDALAPTWFRLVKWDARYWLVAFNAGVCLWKRAIQSKTVGSVALELAKVESEFGNVAVHFDVDQDLGMVPDEGQPPVVVEPPTPPVADVAHPAYFWAVSPHKSNRGTPIKKIVLHNTEGSFSSCVNWFLDSKSKVSAHAVVQRDPASSKKFCGEVGKIAIPVPETAKAWHCSTSNADSLGIEIEADADHLGMTPWQEATVVQLVKHWLKKYGLTKDDIYAHRELANTSCPVRIWPTQAQWDNWINKHFS